VKSFSGFSERQDRTSDLFYARWAAVLLTVALPALGAGCVTANFTQPIASFQKSVNTSSAVIGEYFTNLNDFERRLYLDGRALDPELPVENTDASGQPTPLLGQYFQAASIKARMDSVVLLGVYAQRLTELAASKAPEQFSENAKALGASLTSLNKTFADLSDQKQDQTAASYIKPVSALIGSIGRIYLEQQRDKAIREAINSGAPAVRTILQLLEHDLIEVVKPLQITGLKEKLATRVKYYNDHRQDRDMDLRRRRDLLDEIQSHAVAYEASVAFNPTGLIQSMREAHEALINYANSPRTPENFNDLIIALQTFDQNAQEIGKQIQLIQQATKGK
jgi:hypothetical protein